jgi:hypothetical protein
LRHLQIHSCLDAGEEARCLIFSAEGPREEYVATYLEGGAASMVAGALEGNLSEEHTVMCSFLLSSWEQTDMQVMFATLLFDRVADQLIAQMVLYQKNEIKKKYYEIDVPMPFAVMLSAYCSIPVMMDDATFRAIGRTDIEDLLHAGKERKRNGEEA